MADDNECERDLNLLRLPPSLPLVVSSTSQPWCCITNRTKGNLILQLRASKFLKFQEAKIQELSEHVPKGHIPQTMTVHFRGELTRKVAPGDVVELSGIFLPISYTGYRAMRAGLVADTYLEAMSITHHKKRYEDGPPHFDGGERRFGDRDGYHSGPCAPGGDFGDKGGAPADYRPSFLGARPAFGCGAGGSGGFGAGPASSDLS